MTLDHANKSLCIYKEMPMEDDLEGVIRGRPGYVATVDIYNADSGDPIGNYELNYETDHEIHGRRFGYAANILSRDIDIIAFADAADHGQAVLWSHLLVNRKDGIILDVLSILNVAMEPDV